MVSWRTLLLTVPLFVRPFTLPPVLPLLRPVASVGFGPPAKRSAKQRNKWPARQRAKGRRR